MTDTALFAGFDIPDQNWCKLPIALIEAMPTIKTISEMKVILYVLRHTWGFQEFGIPKPITVDEFMHGRKRTDGSRIDDGTGLVKNSVSAGIDAALTHGFLQVTVDDSDKARIEKAYCLNMATRQGVKDCTPKNEEVNLGGQRLHPRKRLTAIRGQTLTPRIAVGGQRLTLDQRKKLSKETSKAIPIQRYSTATTTQIIKVWSGIMPPDNPKNRDRLLDDIADAVAQYGEGKVLAGVLKAQEQHERGTAIGSWKYVTTILEKSAAADQARKALSADPATKYTSGKYAAFIDNRV